MSFQPYLNVKRNTITCKETTSQIYEVAFWPPSSVPWSKALQILVRFLCQPLKARLITDVYGAQQNDFWQKKT